MKQSLPALALALVSMSALACDPKEVGGTATTPITVSSDGKHTAISWKCPTGPGKWIGIRKGDPVPDVKSLPLTKLKLELAAANVRHGYDGQRMADLRYLLPSGVWE